jgi:hypothetical protein
MHTDNSGPPAADSATAPTAHRDRTWMWVHAGLVDVYGVHRATELLELFAQFVHDSPAEDYAAGLPAGSSIDWDRESGTTTVRTEDGVRDLTLSEWHQVTDLTRFDAWLARREHAEALLRLALSQLTRVGVEAQVTGGPPQRQVLMLTPQQVLQSLEHVVRSRVGSPAWSEAIDRPTACYLLGVGTESSSPERDTALASAVDPWTAEVQWLARARAAVSNPNRW